MNTTNNYFLDQVNLKEICIQIWQDPNPSFNDEILLAMIQRFYPARYKKIAVEATKRYAASHKMPTDNEILVAWILFGTRIPAIRAVKAASDKGLKDSKEYVDSIITAAGMKMYRGV